MNPTKMNPTKMNPTKMNPTKMSSVAMKVVLVAVLGMMVVAAGCDPGASSPDELGSLQLALSGDVDGIDTLELVVTAEAGGDEVFEQTFDVGGSNFSRAIMLPAGHYLIEGVARDDAGETTGAGSAAVSVESGRPAKAVLVLHAPSQGQSGIVTIQTSLNTPPVFSDITVQPTLAAPGDVVTFTAFVEDDTAGLNVVAALDGLATSGDALPIGGAPPIELSVDADGNVFGLFEAPQVPGPVQIRLTATDFHGGTSDIVVPVVVCDPSLSTDGPTLEAAVDTVMSNVANEIFTLPPALTMDSGWTMTLDSGQQVSRALLDYQVEALLAYGFDVVSYAAPWLYANDVGARYAAAHVIRELSGTDAFLPNFDTEGTFDEDALLENIWTPDFESYEIDDGVQAKKCCVTKFVTTWKKNANASATNARLRLDYEADFGDVAPCDPACCEFRQNVKTIWKVTAGTHAGQGNDTSPMHDDNYSRADDTDGKPGMADPHFESNDNPGIPGVAADDVLDYAFTAEQKIIDTCNANAVVATRGPHTGTIKGKAPRTYGGVPKTL